MSASQQEPVSAMLRRQVTLQSPAETTDGTGGFTLSWTNVATVWAAIEPLSGRERMIARKLQSSVTHRITIRYRTGVTARMRVQSGSRVFNIRHVINLEERDELLELLAEEGAGV